MTDLPTYRRILNRGVVIPASPLALTADRRLDERRQRALWRYYSAAGAGGVAIGVHTTQFAIHEPSVGLYEPVLALGRDELNRLDAARAEPMVRIAGLCGPTQQACAEAQTAADLGYHVGLLSLAALTHASEDELLAHCRTVGECMPLMGFYLQPDLGGRVLDETFWRRLAELESVVAVKVAPFHRYRTLDVVRAFAHSGRDDVALYTGNDDNIVADLVTPFRFEVGGRTVERRIVGGLLGHWAFWTRRAVELLDRCHAAVAATAGDDRVAGAGPRELTDLLALGTQTTEANAVVFDVAHDFAGCVPGIHEILRRQGLLAGTWCLNARETLSPGQTDAIDRLCRAYPHLTDDAFVAEHLDEWLSG